MVLNNDVLRRIFEFTIKPDKAGVQSMSSISTLISLRNTCAQFREIIDSSRWNINSIEIEENYVKHPEGRFRGLLSSFIGRRNSSLAAKLMCLLNQYNILQISEINFKLNKLNREQQVKFLADLSASLKGKLVEVNFYNLLIK